MKCYTPPCAWRTNRISSVHRATRIVLENRIIVFRLDLPLIQSGHISLRSTKPTVLWVRGCNAVGAWSWLLTSIWCGVRNEWSYSFMAPTPLRRAQRKLHLPLHVRSESEKTHNSLAGRSWLWATFVSKTSSTGSKMEVLHKVRYLSGCDSGQESPKWEISNYRISTLNKQFVKLKA